MGPGIAPAPLTKEQQACADLFNSLAGLQVEVSCLEDVLQAIKQDSSGEWSSAVFIGPGGLLDQNGKQ